MVEALVISVAVAGSFYAGKVYGSKAEAKLLAEALKIRATFDTDYKAVVAKIKSEVSSLFGDIKKHL